MKLSSVFYIAVATLFLGINSANAQGSISVGPKAGLHTDAVPTSITPTLASPAGLHLKLQSTTAANANDEIGIYFSDAWSDNYDGNDSYDMDGLDPQVYLSSFTADGVRVCINAMSSYTIPKRIKLYVRSVADGSFTLNLEDFTNIDTTLYNINLVDNQQKDSVNMVKFSTYTFSMVASDTSAYSNRFVLAIEPKPLPPYQLADFAGQKVTQGVQVKWTAVNAGNYTGFTLQKLNAENSYDSLYSVQSDSSSTYSYVDPHPIIGNNVYRLAQSGLTGKITYSAPITIGYGTVTPTSSLNVYPNPSKSIINVALTTSGTNIPVYTADIYNMSGTLVKHQSISSTTFTQDISSYKYGVYFIQLKDPNGYLVGQSKFVKSN